MGRKGEKEEGKAAARQWCDKEEAKQGGRGKKRGDIGAFRKNLSTFQCIGGTFEPHPRQHTHNVHSYKALGGCPCIRHLATIKKMKENEEVKKGEMKE